MRRQLFRLQSGWHKEKQHFPTDCQLEGIRGKENKSNPSLGHGGKEIRGCGTQCLRTPPHSYNNHRITQYPELERTHRDYQGQPPGSTKDHPNTTVLPPPSPTSAGPDTPPQGTAGPSAGSDSSCHQPEHPDPFLKGCSPAPQPSFRPHSQGCPIPAAELSTHSSSCRWRPPSDWSRSHCKASLPSGDPTLLPP